jgi:hypothetical protein
MYVLGLHSLFKRSRDVLSNRIVAAKRAAVPDDENHRFISSTT